MHAAMFNTCFPCWHWFGCIDRCGHACVVRKLTSQLLGLGFSPTIMAPWASIFCYIPGLTKALWLNLVGGSYFSVSSACTSWRGILICLGRYCFTLNNLQLSLMEILLIIICVLTSRVPYLYGSDRIEGQTFCSWMPTIRFPNKNVFLSPDMFPWKSVNGHCMAIILAYNNYVMLKWQNTYPDICIMFS